MSRRKPITAPSPRMVDDALRVLHEITTNPDAPDHARVSAAKRLVKADADDADDAAIKAGPACRRVMVIIPDNGRDGCAQGISLGGGMVLTGPDPVQNDRWIAEANAMLDAEAAGAPLALPAPAAPGPRTNAERQRRWRERRAARLAAV